MLQASFPIFEFLRLMHRKPLIFSPKKENFQRIRKTYNLGFQPLPSFAKNCCQTLVTPLQHLQQKIHLVPGRSQNFRLRYLK